MPSFAPIRAVERAIDVLGALNRCPVCTLDMLHRKTGIPKPTLIRLLETLQGKGLVPRAAQYGAYSLTSTSPRPLLHSSTHMRLSLVSHALGRAYLAFCTAIECCGLLHILAL